MLKQSYVSFGLEKRRQTKVPSFSVAFLLADIKGKKGKGFKKIFFSISTHLASSIAPSRMYPAAFMKTSKRPARACRAATVEARVSGSWVTSRSAVREPLAARSANLGELELRAVAMTVKPRLRASRAMPWPNPLEAAVMK